jgi:hypothetical protein
MLLPGFKTLYYRPIKKCGSQNMSNVKVKLSLYRPWRPLGLPEVEAPTFSKQSAQRWR